MLLFFNLLEWESQVVECFWLFFFISLPTSDCHFDITKKMKTDSSLKWRLTRSLKTIRRLKVKILTICKMNCESGGVVEWVTRQTSNLRITSRMGSNPVRGKPLFPWARNFTLIAQYWLAPGTDLRVFI